ncbi:pectate lyase family protein [Vibrio ziniensis]|uniref:Pectate lyase n=1 Tax=Vibrio ziniensis TaxID=2711221 RepID=A0A6G7CEW7_9VIBR|nr:pectate lyase [Vibrio ziniensis]QIH40644.1 pectate lyase [Vibrio ziniensis]QNR59180.1 pectate lyase [Vibrio ziniensis]
MSKKLLALLCASILAGCGGGGSGSGSSDNSDDVVDIGEDITGALTSLGADGWAASSLEVTGGNDAASANQYIVTTRAELIEALYGSSDTALSKDPSNTSKIIYIQGTIDLAEGDDGQTMDGSDFIQAANADSSANCSKYGHTDIDTFYDEYNAEYDPNGDWGKADVSGELEFARQCFQRYQATRMVFRVGSNTSILGLGEDAEIKNGMLRLGKSSDTAVENIVIRNITFNDAFDHFPQWDPTDSDGRWNSQYDLISVENAKGVWIDHNTFSDGERTDDQYPSVFASPYNNKEQKVQHHDGLVDVTSGSTQITLSYNHFKNHDKTNLLGGSDTPDRDDGYGPGAIDVTFHHNYWQNVGQRLPRVRYGRVHVYNNYYKLDVSGSTSPTYYMGDAMTLGTAAKLYVENNVYDITGSYSNSKLIKLSSSTSNQTKCLTAGYTAAECGTYYYATENKVNGSTKNLNSIVTGQESSSSVSVTILDPTDSSSFWLPSFSYTYETDSTDNVKELVLRSAGAGKLIEEE